MAGTSNAQENAPSKRKAYDIAAREAMITAANEFYSADQKLTSGDRQTLANAFWNQMVITPILGLPVIWSFIMIPNWLKQTGRMSPRKNTRYLQVFLGFTGIFVGQAAARGFGWFYYANKFSSDPAKEQVWKVLGPVPSRVGNRYYSLTAKDPKFIMKNPARTNWDVEVPFPLNLVMHGLYVENPQTHQDQLFAVAPNGPGEPTGALTTEPGQPQRATGVSQPQQPSSTGTVDGDSWSRIRSQFDQAKKAEAQGSTQDFTPPSQDFKTPKDDFHESEKKWT